MLTAEERLALGTCGMLRLCRTEYRNIARTSTSTRDAAKRPNRESLRWLQLVEQVDERRGGVECIPLMDARAMNLTCLKPQAHREI
jgi:hypothetical protein